jgi:transmembrane sensor
MRQSDHERRIDEAAHWFAHMRGPDAETSRESFNAWMAASPDNLAAYNEVAEIFGAGKILKTGGASKIIPPAAPLPIRRLSPRSLVAGLAVLGTAFVLLSAHFELRPNFAFVFAGADPIRYATAADRPRGIGLSDGSTILLDAHSQVRVEFGPSQRTLILKVGRVRFDVAHEVRPFVVMAAGSRITAHGTIFDVRIDEDGRATVRLLQGAVDVDAVDRTQAASHRRLAAGQQVRAGADLGVTPPSPAPLTDGRWLTGEIDYDAAPLSAVLAAANRKGTFQIALDDPALGDLRVSGQFGLENTEQLAHALAASLDLDTIAPGNGSIRLRARR